MSTLPYIAITAARNEEENIGRLIESVVAQTALPMKWIIVSDGSTDGTDGIVRSYASKYAFIELLHADGELIRSFASKAGAVSVAYKLLEALDFSMLVVIDADMSLGPDCLGTLLERCEANPKIGIAGALINQILEDRQLDHMATPDFHVAGGLEMFRRECYEQMGGLRQLRYGGMDTLADVMARMHGWKVQTFTDITVNHHGQMGAYRGSLGWGRFYHGIQDYSLGYHPLFFAAKMLRRFNRRPYGLGSLQQALGYFYGFVRRIDRAVESEVVEFMRNEQKARLRDSARSLFGGPRTLEGNHE